MSLAPNTLRPRIRAKTAAAPTVAANVPLDRCETASKRPHKVDRTGPNWDEEGNYHVGKGRPPVATRWRPGQSGNPRGPKPKEKLDPQAEFDKEVLAAFTGKMNGQDVSLTLGTFNLNLMKASAAKGHFRAQATLLQLYREILHKQVAAQGTPEADAWEQNVIDAMLTEMGLPAMPVRRKSRDEAAQNDELEASDDDDALDDTRDPDDEA